jgi:hypothetical protein
MEPTGIQPPPWWKRAHNFLLGATPPVCARPGCAEPPLPGYVLCPAHHNIARDILGEEGCAKPECLSIRFKGSPLCREHFEDDAFGPLPKSDRVRTERRRTVRATHRVPVPGLEIAYEIFLDPTTTELYRLAKGLGLEHEANERRRRLYLFPYLDGALVGNLSAYIYTNGTALIRGLDVYQEFQRRGIASAMYETFRAEHPDLLVDHGSQNANGRAWWATYCARRDLDPTSPHS